jgi:phosphoesterase RecJ-like protein
MVAKTGSETDLTDGFINYARSVDGVEVAASFREPEDGGPWRVSFRSRGRVNVAAIAQKFGGGGHHNAAGCSIDGDEAAVRAEIAQEVEEALKNGA